MDRRETEPPGPDRDAEPRAPDRDLEPPVPIVGEETAGPITESQPPTPEDDSGPNARKAVGLSLAATMVLQLINMISGIELARGLGVEDRGVLAAAMLWPIVIGNIATLGLEEALTFHVARATKPRGTLIGSALANWGIQSLIFTALTCAVIPFVLMKQGSEVIVPALIYSLYVPFNMLGVALNGALNGMHRYSAYNAVRLTVGIAVITAQTILLIVGAFTVEILVIMLVSSYLFTAITAAWLVARAKPGKLTADRETMREILGYGVRSHSSYVPAQLNLRLTQLAVSAFLTASQLGIYVVATTFTSVTALIGGSIAYAALPTVSSLDEDAERRLLARRMVSLTLVLSTLISLPILILAPQLVTLFFGSEFEAAGEITRIFALGSIVLSVNRSLESVLRGVGKPLAAGVSEQVALAAMVVALAALLPLWELTGAAIASVLAYFVAAIWMTRRVQRELEMSPREIYTADREGIDLVVERLRALRNRRAERA